MKLCRNCGVPMVGVMSFSKGKHERYCSCPKCRRQTKHQKIREFDLDFKEVLRNTAVNNRK